MQSTKRTKTTGCDEFVYFSETKQGQLDRGFPGTVYCHYLFHFLFSLEIITIYIHLQLNGKSVFFGWGALPMTIVALNLQCYVQGWENAV